MILWGGRDQDEGPAMPPLVGSEFTADMRAGDQARGRGDWAAAADSYRAALSSRPGDTAAWVQLGNALKDGGNPDAAADAYREALMLLPDDADTQLQLGHACKLAGRREAAIAAYAQAARLDLNFLAPRDELIAMGARDALPRGDYRSVAAWRRLSAIAEVLAQGADAVRDWQGASGYPLAAYDQFRRDFPVRRPPGGVVAVPDGALTVRIDARDADAFRLRATLRSLQDQSVEQWHAQVLCDPALTDHPVASFAHTDPRIALATDPSVMPGAARLLLLDAGTVLDPEALAWLWFAIERCRARAVFADHDSGVNDPVLGLVRAHPVLLGAYDALQQSQIGPPVVVLGDAALLGAADPASAGWVQRRAMLETAASEGGVPHVPRVLATRLRMPLIAGGEPDTPEPGAVLRAAPAPAAGDERIAIVIPTRDASDMLRRAITTLRDTADRPDRLDIVVVDNRSSEAATEALFAEFTANGWARRIALDEPFNWSQASNIGAAASDAPFVAFANNDIEMTTRGWDSRFVAALQDDGVGAIGARLLYPDRTVQHGGMVFGIGPGGVEHEGRYWPASDPGPARRLLTARAVGAVTGAFLGIRRELFEQLGGFDAARLMVSYSDVDLCLRVRECGLTIRYVAGIEAIHHEGATRGRNVAPADIAFDEGERADFVDRWGDSLNEDAGVSPYFGRGGTPFDGLRDPPLSTILNHIDLSGSRHPWRPLRRAAREAVQWRGRGGAGQGALNSAGESG